MTRRSPALAFFFLGLVAVLATPARAALQLDLELSGLTNLVDITNAGDSRLFLVRQQGQILVWDGVAAPTVFLDITALMGGGFEGGMKSIAFPSDYADTGFFFVHYSSTTNASVLARYSRATANTADPASARILISVAQASGTSPHRGGQLAFDPEGMLLMALGDGGPQTDPDCHAQNPSLYHGKILRFDIHQNVGVPPFYGIPADNPFIGAGGFADEVWAYGFRNPWRFSFDRASGALYIADVGQVTREEIDVEPRDFAGGRNYGWRVMEGTFCHDPDPVDPDCPVATPSCGSPLYTNPAFEYDHGGGKCSITGGFVYRGPEHASLVGRYLYGDWCTGEIWANSPQSGWTPEPMPFTLGSITTFGEDFRGNIFLSEGANLYRLADPNAVFTDGFESGDTSAWLP